MLVNCQSAIGSNAPLLPFPTAVLMPCTCGADGKHGAECSRRGSSLQSGKGLFCRKLTTGTPMLMFPFIFPRLTSIPLSWK
ncbi:hypothetical protein [Prevotella fusca]|uniref:Uncharacterized protein n=1 Tax=Prevotella fusca JCM 17724 TaxID=1236517 RepID=A0A0K1NP71_9BACT|nr:hypothetical protein [Prevotella fusca]AKU70481.1 hypothetical protein ADJ77_12060 [Prevotella fusca JCM 17724]QUB86115.1 hypothetical protein J5A51_02290 [Prevotella fusca JCM 17724]